MFVSYADHHPFPSGNSAPRQFSLLLDLLGQPGHSRVYKPVLDELGLTYPQYVTIIALWEEDHQTVKELGDKLFLESSTMTPILKRLETMGYLTRTRDKADERNVRVSLTETGRQLREKGFDFAEWTMKASGLTKEEFPIFQKAVANLRENLLNAGKGAE